MNLKLHIYRTPGSLVAPLRREAGRDGTVFLVPSNRDRPILIDMLLPEGEEGRPAVSFPEGKPRAWIWDDPYRAAAEAVGERPRLQIDPPDHWLLVRRAVHAMRERHPDRLPPGVHSAAFIAMAGHSIRELLAEDVPASELGAALGCCGCEKDSYGGCRRLDCEGGLLCHLYADYITLLDELNLADSAQVPSLGARLLKDHPQAGGRWARGLRIRAAGFLSFTSGQMAFLRALDAAGADLEMWVPECGPGDFYTAVQQFPEAERDSVGGGAAVACISMAAGDLRLSTDTLARELLFWSHGEGRIAGEIVPPFPGWGGIGLCADGEELESVLESFTRYGLPFSVRDGSPVADTSLWRSARRAIELAADEWPPHETADFLSSLLLSPFSFPRSKFLEVLPAGRTAWASFLGGFSPAGGRSAFERAVRFTDALRRGGRPGELLEALAGLAPRREELKLLIERGAGQPGLDGAIREVVLAAREAERKAESLRDLCSDLGEAGAATLSGEEGAAFLAQWAETASVWTPPSASPTISVYPGAPPSLAGAAVWILPGVVASRWPGQVRESPLLSDERKERLHESLDLGRSHLPLVPEKRSAREALFRRLTACGESLCILLRPMADSSGRPLPPSPFEDSALAGESPWLRRACAPLERSLGDILPPDGSPVAAGVEVSLLDLPPLGEDRGRAGKTRLEVPQASAFNLSDIDLFVSCPFRYYCLRVARLEEPVLSRYRPDLAGAALHHLWQKIWERRSATGVLLVPLVEELFDRAVGERYPRLGDDPRLGRFREELRRRARRLAKLQQEMDDGGLLASRRGQRLEFALPELRIGGVAFRGRCDRVDLFDEGALLFDYKGGPSTAFRESLQLAAYSIALAEGDDRLTALATAYLCLGDGKCAGAAVDHAPPYIPPLKGSLPERLDAAREELTRVAESFSTGLFPARYDSASCRFCRFQSICRKRDFQSPDYEEADEDDA